MSTRVRAPTAAAPERAARKHDLERDQFLAIISHELRSPLNGIKSWTHVLETQLRDPDPMTRRALAGIMAGIEHQVRLIEDLLDITRAMNGDLRLIKEPIALLPLLAEAVESMRARAEERQLQLLTDYQLCDEEIQGDAERVRQVFLNLLENALKFTPAGGTIHVNAHSQDRTAVIEVRDNGPGIPPEFLPYLFNPFRQAGGASSNRRADGLGLGLALAQRLAELHGGYVTCDSDGAKGGTSFHVYLPLRPPLGAPSVIPTRQFRGATGGNAPAPSLEGIEVLLIDDQREARESLAALLRHAGARVHVASSGIEALEHLRNRTEPGREVIVCDIAMPGEDGFATLKRIREWEEAAAAPRSPAIALSAYAQREDRIEAIAHGFQTHIAKPVAPAELIAVVASADRGVNV
jgi:CheY-like chemotaxis protein